MRIVAALVAALVPTSDPPREADWSARYVVSFLAEPDGAQRAEVEAVLRWNGGRGSWPDTAELAMAGGYPGGYAAFVRDFEAVVPEGAEAPEASHAAQVGPAEQGRFAVPVLRDGRAAFRYSVPLEHDPAEGLGWDETPHAFSDGTLWTGRALFVTAAGSEVEVELRAPEGARVSTSLEPTGAGSGGYRASDENALRETYLVVGRHLERTLELEGTTLLLVVDGDAAAAADVIEGQVRRFVEAAIETLGGPPPARCLVAITKATGEGGGSVYGHDAHVLVAGPPSEEGPDGWRRTLCHETFHLWNPQKVGFDSREMWFSEGFTDYYANLLLARTGDVSGRAFLGHVAEWASAYVGEAGPVGLREAGELGAKNRTLIYQGGALAALCLDVAIRDASSGKRSLDDVMAKLYELCEAAGGNVSIDELERLLDREGGRSLKGFLERHVAGPEPLPLAETFVRAGLQLEERTVAVPEMDALVHLFQCPGMTVVGGGIEIERTNAGKLKPRDVVVEVAGRSVADFGDLRRALADRAPGDEVAVVVLRKGERESVEMKLGGHGEDLPSSESREVSLEPVAKAKTRARTIRAALFGSELR